MGEFHDIPALKREGWDNCANCGWFYNQAKVPNCPMCRHKAGEPKPYTQPPYEPPSL